MSQTSRLRNQRGVALVAAIFLLVVLAALGVYMVTIAGVQSRTPVFALQGAQAYAAACSGVEWGIYQAENGSCSAGATFPVGNFSVTVTCISSLFQEGGSSYHVDTITAISQQGVYGSGDYISRQVETRVTGP